MLQNSLKWYYEQNIILIFSSNFETLLIKHSPSEILSLNFEKKTVYCHQKGYNDVIHSRALECRACERSLLIMQNMSFRV